MTELLAFAAMRRGLGAQEGLQQAAMDGGRRPRQPRPKSAQLASLTNGAVAATTAARVRQGETSTSGGGRAGELTLLPAWEVLRGGRRGRQYAWDGETIRLVDEDEVRDARTLRRGVACTSATVFLANAAERRAAGCLADAHHGAPVRRSYLMSCRRRSRSQHCTGRLWSCRLRQ